MNPAPPVTSTLLEALTSGTVTPSGHGVSCHLSCALPPKIPCGLAPKPTTADSTAAASAPTAHVFKRRDATGCSSLFEDAGVACSASALRSASFSARSRPTSAGIYVAMLPCGRAAIASVDYDLYEILVRTVPTVLRMQDPHAAALPLSTYMSRKTTSVFYLPGYAQVKYWHHNTRVAHLSGTHKSLDLQIGRSLGCAAVLGQQRT